MIVGRTFCIHKLGSQSDRIMKNFQIKVIYVKLISIIGRRILHEEFILYNVDLYNVLRGTIIILQTWISCNHFSFHACKLLIKPIIIITTSLLHNLTKLN